MEDEEIRLRSDHMRTNPEDNKTYSRWEREERKKPKVKTSEEEEEEEEEDENALKPFDEAELVMRAQDDRA